MIALWAHAHNMSEESIRNRIAVAEDRLDDGLAARLGRAEKFALFDAGERGLRGPFYRVRHGDPGSSCEGQAELVRMLADCRAVITGGAGERTGGMLAAQGIEVVATAERGKPVDLVTRFLGGTLERKSLAAPARDDG